MSNKANRKLTDVNHVRGLAKKMSYEIKSDIDIIQVSRSGIGTCFDVLESRKNKGSKIETVNYIAKVDNIRDNRSTDVLQDSRIKPISTTSKKSTKKRKPIITEDYGKLLVHDSRNILPENEPITPSISEGDTTEG